MTDVSFHCLGGYIMHESTQGEKSIHCDFWSLQGSIIKRCLPTAAPLLPCLSSVCLTHYVVNGITSDPSLLPSFGLPVNELQRLLLTTTWQPATKPRKHVSTRMPTTSVALRGRQTQPASPNLPLFLHRTTSPQSAPLSPFPHRTWKIRRAGRCGETGR